MNYVSPCALDLEAKVRSVAALTGKTVKVLSVDDLVASMTTAVKPVAGVLYEGSRPAASDAGKQVVISAEVVFSILLLCETSVVSKQVDMTTVAHKLLDSIRTAIHGTRSPTGHAWKWQLEAPAAQKGTSQLWVQRWTTAAQLVPVKSD